VSSTGHGTGLPVAEANLDHCAPTSEEEHSAVSEPQRLALRAAAQAALGEQEADTLMAITAPANTDLATRQDVELAAATLRSEFLERLDTIQWRIIGAMIVLHGGTVGLLTLTLG
jgi:hypothetical protein